MGILWVRVDYLGQYGGGMKVLFLTRGDFLEDRKDGGALGTLRNYEMIQRIYGKENVFIDSIFHKKMENTVQTKYWRGYGNLLSTYLGYFCLRDRIPRKTERKIVKHIGKLKPDIIFFDGSTFGQIIRHKEAGKRKTIVFFHNVERQYTWDQVKNYSVLCFPRYVATRYNERKMARHGDKIICLNERDRNLIARYYQRKADLMMPVTFFDTYSPGDKDEAAQESRDFTLLYIGSYYIHNYTGLIWFIEKVLPYVDAKLVVVGKNMEQLEKKIPVSDKIRIEGTVDELSSYYAKADAMVMPVFMGGGMKVKTAEAMMYGKMIFASKEALEGYETAGQKNIRECNSADEFIKAISDCITSGTNKKFHEDVRQIFLDKYNTEKYIPILEQIMK